MRVKGVVKGKMVHVQIDSGSTHNFMDLAVAKKLDCRLETILSFSIFVAYGNKVHNYVITARVTWKMQGVDFKADILVIPLGGADVVLGIQWLITLGDIKWNFKQLKVEFQIGGRKVSLRGSQSGAFKVVADVRMEKVLNKPSQIHMISVVFIPPSQEVSSVQEARVTLNSQELQSSKDLPLTKLLKKDKLGWSEEVVKAFQKLKQAMSVALVLALPDFSLEFVIETDACGVGIGTMLMQARHPLAYMSKALSPKHLQLSVYEKEILAIVTAIDKWRPYLIGRHFVIKTDHQSLEYLLEQRISIPSQQKWLTKLMGYDYTILYIKGKDNISTYALSRCHVAQVQLQMLTTITFDFLLKVQQSYTEEWGSSIQKLLTQLQAEPLHAGVL
ncbi:uncharacterized protein LOC142162204 [Nicotiana tabacum]|uniref:Uncharacterized protein LOC142162204 n=1 Tax=Nicotiana tabacum TaxID=4097 RepID=A0AC58RPF7_TOBAC